LIHKIDPRSLFSAGGGSRIVAIVEELEDCLHLKAGSYVQFAGTLEDVLEETRVLIKTLKLL
jgi:hypothetical protein